MTAYLGLLTSAHLYPGPSLCTPPLLGLSFSLISRNSIASCPLFFQTGDLSCERVLEDMGLSALPELLHVLQQMLKNITSHPKLPGVLYFLGLALL